MCFLQQPSLYTKEHETMILTVHNINEESKLYGLENGTGLPKILYVILAQFVLTTFPQVTVSPI